MFHNQLLWIYVLHLPLFHRIASLVPEQTPDWLRISEVNEVIMGPPFLTWISNYMPGRVWDEITYPFHNFNVQPLKFWNG